MPWPQSTQINLRCGKQEIIFLRLLISQGPGEGLRSIGSNEKSRQGNWMLSQAGSRASKPGAGGKPGRMFRAESGGHVRERKQDPEHSVGQTGIGQEGDACSLSNTTWTLLV